jgi:hypothetical protein
MNGKIRAKTTCGRSVSGLVADCRRKVLSAYGAECFLPSSAQQMIG